MKGKHDAGVGREKMSSRMRSREKNVDGKGKNCRGEKKRNRKRGRGVDGSGRVKKRLFPTKKEKKIYPCVPLSVCQAFCPSLRPSLSVYLSRCLCVRVGVRVLVYVFPCAIGVKSG